MKVLQFYFNPKQEKRHIFKSFCFLPSTKEEEKLGCLVLVAELEQAERNDKKFLKKIAAVFKNEYYRDTQRILEESFRTGLCRVNRALKRKLKRESLDWQTKLNLAALAIGSDFSAVFAQIGGLRIFLLRDGEIFDSGENLDFKGSGIKKFSKIASGKLAEDDRVLVLNQKLFSQFWENRFFSYLKQIKTPKELKKFFKKNKQVLRHFCGVLVFAVAKSSKRKLYLRLLKPKIHWLKLSFFKKVSLKERILLKSPFLRRAFKKSFIKLLILLCLLFLGYLIF